MKVLCEVCGNDYYRKLITRRDNSSGTYCPYCGEFNEYIDKRNRKKNNNVNNNHNNVI